MKKNLPKLFATFLTGFLLTVSGAQGAISYVKISTDANSGISSANTYTHALDFGAATGDGRPETVIINGVTFSHADFGSLTAGTYNLTLTGTTGNNYGNPSYTGGGTVDSESNLRYLVGDSIYTDSASSPYTLSGLVSGQTYEVRLYFRTVEPAASRIVGINFGGESTGDFDQYRPESGGHSALSDAVTDNLDAFYIGYQYTADISGNFVINVAGPGGGPVIYGVTNQIVIPEPQSVLLSIMGSVMLLSRRRR